MGLLLQGWLIGFVMSVPVGPITTLCIRHALIRGTLYGLMAGLGAALADTLYGIIAGLGVTIICDILTNYQMTCQLLGGLFLCYLGIVMLRTPPRAKSQEVATPLSYTRVFFLAFILTLSNPLTLIGFIGIYAALGIGLMHGAVVPFLLITGGLFVGCTTWWLLVSASSSLIAKKINIQSTGWLNRISGAALLTFGVIIGLAALQEFPFLSL